MQIGKMLSDNEKGVLKSLDEIEACGHRVVHGGEKFSGSHLIDDELERSIIEVSDLAPLHNPPNLLGIRATRKMFGEIPMVACFDTAFHQTIPAVAYTYGLQQKFYDQYGIRRYGFHGISHRYVARRASELLGREKYDVNLITCHLGNGSSVTAIKKGKSIDTSMGMTPLEGLLMGTRSGDIDPEIIIYLQGKGYAAEQISNILNKQSGLLGISGRSNDVRDLENLAADGDPQARLALDIFAYRVRKYIGAYLALAQMDGIVFTGGIGENGMEMRQRILAGMDHLGIILDTKANLKPSDEDRNISSARGKLKIFVIHTNEEAAIAKDTYELVMANTIKT